VRDLQIPKKFRPYLTSTYEFHCRNFGLIFVKTRNFSGNTEGLMCPKTGEKGEKNTKYEYGNTSNYQNSNVQNRFEYLKIRILNLPAL